MSLTFIFFFCLLLRNTDNYAFTSPLPSVSSSLHSCLPNTDSHEAIHFSTWSVASYTLTIPSVQLSLQSGTFSSASAPHKPTPSTCILNSNNTTHDYVIKENIYKQLPDDYNASIGIISEALEGTNFYISNTHADNIQGSRAMVDFESQRFEPGMLVAHTTHL